VDVLLRNYSKGSSEELRSAVKALPLEGEAIHAAYAGQAVWFVVIDYIPLSDVHEENQKVLGNLPGTIGIEAYPPETNLHRTELVIVYGPNFYPRTPFAGENL